MESLVRVYTTLLCGNKYFFPFPLSLCTVKLISKLYCFSIKCNKDQWIQNSYDMFIRSVRKVPPPLNFGQIKIIK